MIEIVSTCSIGCYSVLDPMAMTLLSTVQLCFHVLEMNLPSCKNLE